MNGLVSAGLFSNAQGKLVAGGAARGGISVGSAGAGFGGVDEFWGQFCAVRGARGGTFGIHYDGGQKLHHFHRFLRHCFEKM